MAATPEWIDRLEAISGRYSTILCDVWGVVHNGITPHPDAVAALQRARKRGLAVVLITNSPRPHRGVEAQLAAIGVADTAWDRVVTSGDVTRDLIRSAPRKLFHLGPERELSIYDGLDVELVEEFEAAAIVCTGLFDDETESPADYAEMLLRMRSRDLPFICANPDIVVERGEKLVWCAGALARDYAQLGGRTQIAGKPHPPIYDLALRAASEVLGRKVSPAETLAIGDGILTDVKGAAHAGIDVVYVTGGIHWRDYGGPLDPDPERLHSFLQRHGHQPVAVMPRLQ